MNEAQAKMSKGPFDFDRTIPLLSVFADTLEVALRKISAIESVQEWGLLSAVHVGQHLHRCPRREIARTQRSFAPGMKTQVGTFAAFEAKHSADESAGCRTTSPATLVCKPRQGD